MPISVIAGTGHTVVVGRLPTFVRRVLTAVVVGVATIFLPKTKPHEHWSTPPTVTREEETPDADASGPPLRRG